ncbi:MAG TPA: hypothetical protein VNJ53_03965 [Gaiellaceae bacterium]|nr:hypothetical protein [Gaiellaceae bacterium]
MSDHVPPRSGVFASYRYDWLVVLLLTMIAFSFFYKVGPQDITRLALAQAVVQDGSLRIDRWRKQTVDRGYYEGHYYADKAPGMSFLAIPLLAALRATGNVTERNEARGIWKVRWKLWTFRLFTSGLGYVLVLVLVGAVAERLVRGTGFATVSAFGLGTLVLPLAAIMFQHVLAAALAFATFVAAWAGLRAARRRDALFALAGVVAGAAVLVEYQIAVVAGIVFVYLALQSRRGAAIYVAAGLPSALLLGLYNYAAFESPFRLSYNYVSIRFAAEQDKGLFGIGVPDPVELLRVLFSWNGLLTQSPLLALAAVGLVLMWRRALRAEAAVCAGTALLFLVLTAGYYDPVGGESPGPRFFTPALPFLVLGLPYAFRRWPYATTGAAAISVGTMLYRCGTWTKPKGEPYVTIWSLLGADKEVAILLVGVAALGLLTLAARHLLATEPGRPALEG